MTTLEKRYKFYQLCFILFFNKFEVDSLTPLHQAGPLFLIIDKKIWISCLELVNRPMGNFAWFWNFSVFKCLLNDAFDIPHSEQPSHKWDWHHFSSVNTFYSGFGIFPIFFDYFGYSFVFIVQKTWKSRKGKIKVNLTMKTL